MTPNIFDRALLAGGGVDSPFSGPAVYFEYSQAANPIADGMISPVPAERFGPELYGSGPSRVVPLDLAKFLHVPGPATSPTLCANFARICAGDSLVTRVNASSQMFYVLAGQGSTSIEGGVIHWQKGDFFTLPARADAIHRADEETAFYWVHDEPLLAYLGAEATERRFEPTHYRHDDAERCLAEVAADPEAASRSRVSVLLANKAMDQTLTMTHVLWTMYGILPEGGLQPPHRHQSVAVDLVLDCRPGCYTLLGDLDPRGERLVDVERVDWEPGAAFVTPPGRWHSHHNESGADAHIIPIQDAGLHTYLRTLDIRFMSRAEGDRVLAASLPVAVS